MYRPYTLICELTHRCPLRCAYCSNPLRLASSEEELDTATWERVLSDAAALGVLQVHFTGGEPLLRGDLERLVSKARDLDLYTNLVTSGLPTSPARFAKLRDAGLEHVQLSLQGSEAGHGRTWAGRDASRQKWVAAREARACGLALTINFVLHRGNIDAVASVILLARDLGAERLEVASVQYLGWALENRAALLPSSEELISARRIVEAARSEHSGSLQIDFVLPDYYSGYPRACMDGWGRRYVVVSPDGFVLPCHAARSLPGLSFANVRSTSLRVAWTESPAFEAFRGDGWMTSPCRDCDRRATDFGGCRCQAFLLTGNPRATDPACSLSPAHQKVRAARVHAMEGKGGFIQLRTFGAKHRLSES